MTPRPPHRRPVFVYGTLRAGGSNAGVLDGFVTARTAATLRGHRLHVLEHPCAVEDPATTGAVRGEVLTFVEPRADEAIERLDRFEGFAPRDPARSLYVRVTATADLDDGTVVDCWVYLAGAGLRARLAGANRIPSGDWLAR